VPIELVEVVHGDTSKIPFGMGTYASRSLAGRPPARAGLPGSAGTTK
jgi:hypothetical protein